MAGAIKRDIGGVIYESSPFPPFDGIGMGARLLKVIGPSIIGIIRSFIAGGNIKDMLSQDSGVLVDSVQSALVGMQPKEFQQLCLDLLKHTWQGPTPARGTQLQLNSEGNFNLAFLGDYGSIWSAIWLALEANDFFVGGGIGKRLRAKLTPPSSPEPSTPASSMS